MSISDYSNNTTKSSPIQDYSDNNYSFSSFEEPEFVPSYTRPPLDYTRILREDHDRKKNQLNELRLDHARKRASLAARFGAMPFTDPLGGIIPYYHNDSIMNGSAPYYNNVYKKLW